LAVSCESHCKGAIPAYWRHDCETLLLSGYFQSLQKAGHRCELSTYEYGGLIDCQTRADKRVLIDLVAEPTHGPEFARAAVRPDGVNSKELASSEVAPFLESLIAGPSAPGSGAP
jgi:hypothetical protein